MHADFKGVFLGCKWLEWSSRTVANNRIHASPSSSYQFNLADQEFRFLFMVIPFTSQCKHSHFYKVPLEFHMGYGVRTHISATMWGLSSIPGGGFSPYLSDEKFKMIFPVTVPIQVELFDIPSRHILFPFLKPLTLESPFSHTVHVAGNCSG